MARKVKDFDKFREERKKKDSISFTLFGNTYDLPPSVPFDAAMIMRDISRRPEDSVVTDEDVFQMIEATLGEDRLKEFRKHAEFDIELAMEILNWIIEAYGLNDSEDEKSAVGKSKATGS